MFTTGIGSRNYGGQEVLPSAVCDLQNQEVSGMIQPKPRARRSRGTRVQGQEKTDVPAQGERDLALLLAFSSVPTLSGPDDGHPHGWADLLYSEADLSQTYPQKHTRK